MGKKPIVSVTYENERTSIKNSLPYLKCVLRLSCVVHRPIYGRFMGFSVNGFLSIKVYIVFQIYTFYQFEENMYMYSTMPACLFYHTDLEQNLFCSCPI